MTPAARTLIELLAYEIAEELLQMPASGGSVSNGNQVVDSTRTPSTRVPDLSCDRGRAANQAVERLATP